MTREQIEKARKKKKVLCDAKAYVVPEVRTLSYFRSFYIPKVSEFLEQNEIDNLNTMADSFYELCECYNTYISKTPLAPDKYKTIRLWSKDGKPTNSFITVTVEKETLDRGTQNLVTMVPAKRVRCTTDTIDPNKKYPVGTTFPKHYETIATYDGPEYVNLKNCRDNIAAEINRITAKIKNFENDSVFSFKLFCENS